MRLLILLLLAFTLNSCQTGVDKKSKELSKDTTALKAYQQYALDRIIQADFDDQGFHLTDSFYLWSWDDFGREFNQNRITRTYYDGFYRYTFWTHRNDTALIYAEDSIPSVQLLQDTMFDTNGDGAKDLVATYNPNNGKCPPNFTMLFLMDTTNKKFRKIDAIELIPNAMFHPKEKTISSELNCEQYNEQYKFEWNRNFGVDTIYSKVTKH